MRRRADSSQSEACAEKADAELIAEMHQPGSEALSALFRRYIRLVHRVAADILRDHAEAEDVTQEVFLEIYRKSHLYDPSRGAVRVWLLQYAYRRSIRRKDVLRRRAAYGGEPLDDAEKIIATRPLGLSREECRWVIRTGLAKLTKQQRATLELACLEEVSLRDVAERLRVSLGSARHYYYRGLARLRAWAASPEMTRPGTVAPARGDAGRAALHNHPTRRPAEAAVTTRVRTNRSRARRAPRASRIV